MAFGSIQNQNSAYSVQDDISQILTNTNTLIGSTNTIGGGVSNLQNSNGQILSNTNTLLTNTNALLTNTKTNNTASNTGTLSQKLSYIINQISSGITNKPFGETKHSFPPSSDLTNLYKINSFSTVQNNRIFMTTLNPGIYRLTIQMNNVVSDGFFYVSKSSAMIFNKNMLTPTIPGGLSWIAHQNDVYLMEFNRNVRVNTSFYIYVPLPIYFVFSSYMEGSASDIDNFQLDQYIL